jgi:sulfate/thiosulfate transport system permease protein
MEVRTANESATGLGQTRGTPGKRRSILPGFGLTMGFTLTYLSLVVLIPLAGLIVKSASMSRGELWAALSDDKLLFAFKLTVGMSVLAAGINVVFGFITAWTLVRIPFPGRKLVDALIDLPFALPTAVGGITLATLWARDGWIGGPWSWAARGVNGLAHARLLPEQVAYSQLGILVALVFIGVPFVVRTLQPALEDMDPEVEEAAASLGAGRGQAFRRVVVPALRPALLTGFALAFARAMGEYGSVIFISSNLPGYSQVASHLIAAKLEKPLPDYGGAAMLGVLMLGVSFAVLLAVNGMQWWSRRVRAEGA